MDVNAHISGPLKELSLIYKSLDGPQDQWRFSILSKAATAVSNHPTRIRTRADVLSIKRLPGSRRAPGKTIDKVQTLMNILCHSCVVIEQCARVLEGLHRVADSLCCVSHR